jgi:LPPG:FO 2-phospho-L-lactate transferase
LCAVLPPEQLTLIVNTADDFEHWGLHIAPDLDTVMYSVSGVGHEARGWGLQRETFDTLAALKRLEPRFPIEATTWFQLGNTDLATHLVRSQALSAGKSLSEVSRGLFQSFGVEHRVLPMSDAKAPSFIHTRPEPGKPSQRLSFQDWLVKRRAQDRVQRVELTGSTTPAPGVLEALEQADVVLVAPSNPYVSIDPILRLHGVAERVALKPSLGVSPIVGGRAVKGPLAEMLRDLEDLEPSPAAVVNHYARCAQPIGLAACLVEAVDLDAARAELPIRWEAAETLMTTHSASVGLAQRVVELAAELVAS